MVGYLESHPLSHSSTEKQTVISLGDEDEERWEIIKTDSEFTLKRFKKVWLETEDE